MHRSETVVSVGAACFGIVIGYITYRTLARAGKASVGDIAAVIAAVGGGAVTTVFDQGQSDSFGWYSIGLLTGMALYLIASLVIRGRTATARVMAAGDPWPEMRSRPDEDDIKPEQAARL
jgi:hypothetical protein